MITGTERTSRVDEIFEASVPFKTLPGLGFGTDEKLLLVVWFAVQVSVSFKKRLDESNLSRHF